MKMQPLDPVFAAFGHNELCLKWKLANDSLRLDESATCTCGQRALTEHERLMLDAAMSWDGQPVDQWERHADRRREPEDNDKCDRRD